MAELLKIKLTKEELDRAEVACIRAGYSPKNARRTASRFLQTPCIREIIDKAKAMEEEGEKRTPVRTRARFYIMHSMKSKFSGYWDLLRLVVFAGHNRAKEPVDGGAKDFYGGVRRFVVARHRT